VNLPVWILAAFGSVRSVRQMLSTAHATPVKTLPSPAQVTEVEAVPSPYQMSYVKSINSLWPVIISWPETKAKVYVVIAPVTKLPGVTKKSYKLGSFFI
jgi:hypothetical protein